MEDLETNAETCGGESQPEVDEASEIQDCESVATEEASGTEDAEPIETEEPSDTEDAESADTEETPAKLE